MQAGGLTSTGFAGPVRAKLRVSSRGEGGRRWGPPGSARPQKTGVKGHWPCAQCPRPATCGLAGAAGEQETPCEVRCSTVPRPPSLLMPVASLRVPTTIRKF